MKKIIVPMLVFASAMIWTSCSDDSNVTPSDEAAAKGKSAPKTNIWAATGSLSGNTLTIEIDGTQAQDASHLLIQAVSCAGSIIAPTGAAYVNGVEVSYVGTTGNGTDCYFDSGSFIKIDSDELNGVGKTFTVTVNFDQEIQGASLKVKSGQSCSDAIAFNVNNCDGTPEPCGEGETSYAGNSSVKPKQGSWFAYITLDGNGSANTDLLAGQHHDVGNVSVVKDGDELVITVTLAEGVTLQSGDNWYMESYTTAPTSRPNSGHMAYKGEETGTTFEQRIAYVGDYVVVHVDVIRPCDN